MVWAVAVFVAVAVSTTSWPLGLFAAACAYLISVQAHPWTTCWWCGGNARRRDGRGTSWRNCWVCGGSGKRRRLFARRLG